MHLNLSFYKFKLMDFLANISAFTVKTLAQFTFMIKVIKSIYCFGLGIFLISGNISIKKTSKRS